MRTRKEKNQVVERTMRTLDEILAPLRELNKKTESKIPQFEPAMAVHLDAALESLTDDEQSEYEEAIELWIRYGGD